MLSLWLKKQRYDYPRTPVTYGLVSALGEIAVRLLLFPSHHSEQPQLGGNQTLSITLADVCFLPQADVSVLAVYRKSKEASGSPTELFN